MNENNEVTISLSITPTWSILNNVQQKTEKFVKSKGLNKDMIDATIMCASELVENAIKYGSEKPDGSNITFDLSFQSGEIRVKVSNGVKSEGDKDNVFEHIEKVKSSESPAKLYTDRLMELMENPKPGISQLGLYRIAYEGEFHLDCSFDNNILTIIATRKA